MKMLYLSDFCLILALAPLQILSITPTSTENFDYFQPNNDLFPEYQMRIKNSSKLLDPFVQQYSGYIDTPQGPHFFFWLFESRDKPKDDPLVVWLSGGPGCSSLDALLFETGPSVITTTDPSPQYNNHSWNSHASILYLDQPVFTGFSYNDDPDISLDTDTASKDFFAFLTLFFEKFPQYKSLELALAGESYAGRFIPIFAKDIFDHTNGKSSRFYNQSPEALKLPDFTLNRILIGNGITDPLNQYPLYPEMACFNSYQPLLSFEECAYMRALNSQCLTGIEECYRFRNPTDCANTANICGVNGLMPVSEAGWSIYDIRKRCYDPINYCNPGYIGANKFLHNEENLKEIGAKGDWARCDGTVYAKFLASGDALLPDSVNAVRYLLNVGMHILIYAGDADYICNWKGNHAWVNKLAWNCADEFRESPLTPIKNSLGEVSGELQKYSLLTFYRIYNAGHMVPHDQPYNSLEMLDLYMADKLDYTD